MQNLNFIFIKGMGKVKITEVKKQVEYVLQQYPATRNSDKLLTVKVLQEFYKVKEIDDILNEKIPSLESIRRARQLLQHKGLYLSDKKIQQEKNKLEIEYKEFARS